MPCARAIIASLDSSQVVLALAVRGLGELVGTQVLHQEVLVLRPVVLHVRQHFLGQAILDAPALHLRDLVMGMAASDLICPLHFLSLDHQLADLHLAVLSRREGHNEVRAFLAVGLELALLRVALELSGRVVREESVEVGVVLQVIR